MTASATAGACMEWREEIHSRFPDWGTPAALVEWQPVKAALAIGDAVRGEVIARAPFGVWLDIGCGHPALLQVVHMANPERRRIPFEDYPKIGELVESRIMALGDRAEIGLIQDCSNARE